MLNNRARNVIHEAEQILADAFVRMQIAKTWRQEKIEADPSWADIIDFSFSLEATEEMMDLEKGLNNLIFNPETAFK